MHQRITETFREALAKAQREARGRKQDFISTEHLLLGLLDAGGEAASLLLQNGVAVPRLRAAVLHELPMGKQSPVVTGDLPLSPKAQQAINTALVRAQALREAKVSTRVVLLALLDEPETAVRRAMAAGGADLDALEGALARRPDMSEA